LFLMVVGPRSLGTFPVSYLAVVDTGAWEVRSNTTTQLTIVTMAYDEATDRLFAWVFGESMPVQTSLVLLDPATATAVTTYAPSLMLTPLTMNVIQGVVYSSMDLSYSDSGWSLVGRRLFCSATLPLRSLLWMMSGFVCEPVAERVARERLS
jgi:hypothetical protein